MKAGLVCGTTVTDDSDRKIKTGVFQCPSFTNPTTTAMWDGGYGWNGVYVGWRWNQGTGQYGPCKVQQITRPSNTILAGDGSELAGHTDRMARVQPPSSWSGLSVGDRHNNGIAINVLWADGHVTSETRNKLLVGTGKTKEQCAKDIQRYLAFIEAWREFGSY